MTSPMLAARQREHDRQMALFMSQRWRPGCARCGRRSKGYGGPQAAARWFEAHQNECKGREAT